MTFTPKKNQDFSCQIIVVALQRRLILKTHDLYKSPRLIKELMTYTKAHCLYKSPLPIQEHIVYTRAHGLYKSPLPIQDPMAYTRARNLSRPKPNDTLGKKKTQKPTNAWRYGKKNSIK